MNISRRWSRLEEITSACWLARATIEILKIDVEDLHYDGCGRVSPRVVIGSLIWMLAASLATARADTITLVAAGSLKEPFGRIAERFTATHPSVVINFVWGPSGTLRDSIAKGSAFDIFASAALPHAQTITDRGLSGPTVLFVRNTLCGFVRAPSEVTTDTLVDYLLKPQIRLATSTPVSDPGGDYTWQLFRLIERSRPGAYALLSGKAQQVFGGPATTTPLDGRHRLAVAMAEDKADAALYYCSAGSQLASQIGIKIIPLPSDLAIGPEYGLTIAKTAPAIAAELTLFILSPDGQTILQEAGFIPVTLPAGTR